MCGWLSPFGPGKVPDTGLSVPQILSEKKAVATEVGTIGQQEKQ